MKQMWFDRTVADGLIEMLAEGPANELVRLAREDPGDKPLYDLQLRRETQGGNPTSWASLYFGLTKLVDLEWKHGKGVRLDAAEAHRQKAPFDSDWRQWQSREELEEQWPAVHRYLTAVPDVVAKSHIGKEGQIHAAVSSETSDAYRIINREVSPGFVDQPTKDRLTAAWWQPIDQAVRSFPDPPPWWPLDAKVGVSPDHLGVDIGGRLLIIESKHNRAQAQEITKVPVQVGFYARMFRELLDHDEQALANMERMLDQRIQLGLSGKGVLYLTRRRTVVPVVAIGPGRPSDEAKRRLWHVALATSTALGPGVDPIELWFVDEWGRITQVERPGDIQLP